ncbi:MAG: hypothetical protein HUJ65_03820 [Oscillospiraceae bacterium]|nr:hypothetical protein [Oscillospiraceae bacterium]
MNLRENYMAFLHHEKTERIPVFLVDAYICGGNSEIFENGPAGGGYDDFGVRWVASDSANGQSVPAANEFVLTDITAWEDIVKFPDLDALDWEKYAEEQLAGKDKTQKVLEYHAWNSQFLRLTHLMGFEEALCAFYEEPEATKALLSAITDYKIKLVERVHKYIAPDSFVNYDDVATERGLFMSPQIYREFIKPEHKRMNDAVIALGMIPQQHCCGKCSDIIPDFIDEGSVAWQAAQPTNDIAAILGEYGDRISIFGGYDTQGRPGSPDVTIPEIEAEVERCYRDYGKFGRSYGFFGLVLGGGGDSFGKMLAKAMELSGK